MRNEVLIATGATSELDNKALAHEVGAIFELVRRKLQDNGGRKVMLRTESYANC